jgi:hypothetical protein
VTSAFVGWLVTNRPFVGLVDLGWFVTKPSAEFRLDFFQIDSSAHSSDSSALPSVNFKGQSARLSLEIATATYW